MRKINVVCPICSKFKRISLSKEIFEVDEGSLLKWYIPKGKICCHQFLVILDYNFSVRDYELITSELKFKKYDKRQHHNSLNLIFQSL